MLKGKKTNPQKRLFYTKATNTYELLQKTRNIYQIETGKIKFL